MRHEQHRADTICTKCVINIHEVAALAPVAAAEMGDDPAANRLARVSAALVSLYALRMPPPQRKPSDPPCEHAQKLLQLSRATEWEPETDKLLNGWADEILDDIGDMIGRTDARAGQENL